MTRGTPIVDVWCSTGPRARDREKSAARRNRRKAWKLNKTRGLTSGQDRNVGRRHDIPSHFVTLAQALGGLGTHPPRLCQGALEKMRGPGVRHFDLRITIGAESRGRLLALLAGQLGCHEAFQVARTGPRPARALWLHRVATVKFEGLPPTMSTDGRVD